MLQFPYTAKIYREAYDGDVTTQTILYNGKVDIQISSASNNTANSGSQSLNSTYVMYLPTPKVRGKYSLPILSSDYVECTFNQRVITGTVSNFDFSQLGFTTVYIKDTTIG